MCKYYANRRSLLPSVWVVCFRFPANMTLIHTHKFSSLNPESRASALSNSCISAMSVLLQWYLQFQSSTCQEQMMAFALVSRLISQCKFDLLEELVSKEMIQLLKEKLSSLSENHKSALAADMDEIMYTTAGDVGIYYDDNGRKFVSILMRFWYLTSVDLPDEAPDGTKIFQFVFGDGMAEERKCLLTANYEFQREFTQGVKPDWTITRIEHPKLFELAD
ncbi:m-AAA protease-interacting protein 1, mitochondrial isoform X3 [Varanus komodoensis]|uniref:m-AAA protease-interacting protein 1, mitochondrial isoform X3 n=1 Tax=Varanus komodoensis TaxID=61221 RepID=UPI001CF79A20|nr:m-AAA protease-interacting protein 1, mitochondrial isoform X3 [Varanus komodoensis]